MKYGIPKIKHRLWLECVNLTKNTSIYPLIYKSYWHMLLSPKMGVVAKDNFYFSSTPNPGAGIGHQMANWISGYWWAKQFKIKFAHIPFSSPQWELFLGFGEDEVSVNELAKKGYRKVKLPLFDEFNQNDLNRTRRIIQSYSGSKVVFICEQDQSYVDQFGVMTDIQRKFYNASSRKADQLVYSKDCYNIAIHVRRGDITIGQKNKNSNLLLRWQSNEYFIQVLSNVIKRVTPEKEIRIYLFSQGKECDFQEFKSFSNMNLCLEMSAIDSFLHMLHADLLITSKSSFSYKPALLNRGIKVCPKKFWHGYPESEDWIIVDDSIF
jgi:hypothetical protein